MAGQPEGVQEPLTVCRQKYTYTPTLMLLMSVAAVTGSIIYLTSAQLGDCRMMARCNSMAENAAHACHNQGFCSIYPLMCLKRGAAQDA